MNSIIKEWINKAEANYRTAERESVVQDGANYDAVCFHAQQCIEKLLKAVLIKNKVSPPKIHVLTVLSQLLTANKQPLFNIQQLRFLSNAAISFRYPGDSADRADAEESFQICSELRRILHELLTDKCNS
jgi:HEPN domain-containing protein